MPQHPFVVADRPEQWPVRASRDLHRDGWVIALREDEIQRPDQDVEPAFTRVVLEHPGAAIVLAADEQERVFCLSQYRHPATRRFVELPAGLCDAGDENPQAVAVRELLEEAELAAGRWTHLGSTWSSPGISAEVMHFYLAQELTPADRGDFVLAHEEAEMTTAWVPFADLYAAVLSGAVADAPLVTAILLAHARGLLGQGRGTGD